jgi:hypothetical protein
LLASAVTQTWSAAVEVRIIGLLAASRQRWTSDVAAAEFPRRSFEYVGADDMAEQAHSQARYALSAPIWANDRARQRSTSFGK